MQPGSSKEDMVLQHAAGMVMHFIPPYISILVFSPPDNLEHMYMQSTAQRQTDPSVKTTEHY